MTSKNRPKIIFFQISWKLIENLVLLTTYSRKLIKFLKFKKKIHQNRINGLDFRAAGSSKSVSRVQKSRLKSSKNGQKIDFFEKNLTVTDIFFDFMGGYRSTFSRKIGQKRVFWFNIALSEVPKFNIRVSKKDKNIHFMQKLSMTMCFSSLIATTFVLTLFGLAPYLGLCILVVKVFKVQLWR